MLMTKGHPAKFTKSDGKVYWNGATIKGADYDTFEPLSFIWARDKTRIYTYGRPVRGADLETFEVLNALYARDRNRAYYLSGPIKEANAATFRVLDVGWFDSVWPGIVSVQGYATDDAQVFHHVLTIGKPRLVKGADVGTFRVVGLGYAVDKARVYYEGVPLLLANPESFRTLGHYYSTDGKRVYYANTLVLGAEADSFQVGPADQLHGFDEKHKYDRHEVVG
jgi:hypothetical protein